MQPNIGQGDRGKSKLFGKSCWKDELIFQAYGALDELNSFLGYTKAKEKKKEIKGILNYIQDILMRIAVNCGITKTNKKYLPQVKKDDIKNIEAYIRKFERNLKPLDRFLIPGDNEMSALYHILRSKTRSVERILVSLKRKNRLFPPEALSFINRLSDLFFTLSRLKVKKQKETTWKGREKI